MTEPLSAKELSRAFFVRESRLTTWHTVLGYNVDPPEAFRAKDIFDAMQPDGHMGTIGQELGILASIGAITPMPEAGPPPSKYYRRLDGAIWSVVAELASRTVELSAELQTEQ